MSDNTRYTRGEFVGSCVFFFFPLFKLSKATRGKRQLACKAAADSLVCVYARSGLEEEDEKEEGLFFCSFFSCWPVHIEHSSGVLREGRTTHPVLLLL